MFLSPLLNCTLTGLYSKRKAWKCITLQIQIKTSGIVCFCEINHCLPQHYLNKSCLGKTESLGLGLRLVQQSIIQTGTFNRWCGHFWLKIPKVLNKCFCQLRCFWNQTKTKQKTSDKDLFSREFPWIPWKTGIPSSHLGEKCFSLQLFTFWSTYSG